MTENIEWHLNIPICRVLCGLKTHLSVIGLKRSWQLCYQLQVSSLDELTNKMWAMIKAGKSK